jgi:hypothetical protein
MVEVKTTYLQCRTITGEGQLESREKRLAEMQ